MRSDWIRVTRQQPCPACKKNDWCTRSADGRVAICMRVRSDKPTKNGGYIHRLGDGWSPPPRYIRQRPRAKVQRDWPSLAAKCHAAMTDDGWRYLGDELGLGTEPLKAMQVGWDGSQSCHTFPMRNDAGDAVGIRTRHQDGKRSVSGSDGHGLFFVPSMLESQYLIVCEGPTDTAAIIDAGFKSVVGKPSCKLGDGYVVGIVRKLKPRGVLLIPDRDPPGLEGFSILANEILRVMPFESLDSLVPPTPLNDVRTWLQKNRDHLGGRIAAKIEDIKQRTEAIG